MNSVPLAYTYMWYSSCACVVHNLTTPFFSGKSHIMLALCCDLKAADYAKNYAGIILASLPLSQYSLLRGQTWWGKHTWRVPLAILLMIFMTMQKPSNWGSMWRLDIFSCRTWTVAHQGECFLEDQSAKSPLGPF